jgi:hypothetical protein
MQHQARRPARDRVNHLQVVVDSGERQRIQERAKEAGLSVSAYLRAAGLGKAIKPVLDHAAVSDLVRVAGDQGRLGGLLKLWLVDRPGRGASEAEIRRLLDRIGDLQTQIAEVVGRV